MRKASRRVSVAVWKRWVSSDQWKILCGLVRSWLVDWEMVMVGVLSEWVDGLWAGRPHSLKKRAGRPRSRDFSISTVGSFIGGILWNLFPWGK